MVDPLEFLQGISWSSWLAAILGLLALIRWQGLHRYNLLLGNSPLPGPKPWPWIGNLPDVFKYGGIHKMLLNYFYKYGNVHRLCLGRTPAIVVSDPEIVRQIMVKEFWKFRNRPAALNPKPPLGSNLFIARDENWRRIRNTISPTFTAAKLKQIVPIIEMASEKLISKMQRFSETGESADVSQMFSLFALDVIMKAAFGLETDIQLNPDPVFVEKAKRVFQTPFWIRFFSMFPLWNYFRRYVNVLQEADYFLTLAKEMVEQRNQQGFKGQTDLVQLMLNAHEEHVDGVSKLSDDEIMAQCVLFLVAGFETTGNTLTSIAYYLATYPDVQDRLLQEIDELVETRDNKALYDVVQKVGYIDQVIWEVLRLCGPAFNIIRECAEDTIYKGIRFPKGISINIPMYVLHRDPQVWENPLEFNPQNFSPEAKQKRDPFSFQPFGSGPRQCIGMRLAMLEIKLGLMKVLRRFKFERAPETVVTLEHKAMLLMSPKDTIYIKIRAR